MAQRRAIAIDSPTKKALVAGIAALCLCVIGALLVVGRGSGGTSFEAAARAASGTTPPTASGGTTQDGGAGSGRNGLGGGAQGGDGTLRSSFEEFRQCLQDQGVTLPDPGERSQGQRPALSDTLRRAFEACRQYLPARPSGGPGFGGPGDQTAPPFGTPPSGQGRQDGGRGSGDPTF